MDVAGSEIRVRLTVGDGKHILVFPKELEVEISHYDMEQLLDDFPDKGKRSDMIRRIFTKARQYLGDKGDEIELCNFGRLNPIWWDREIVHVACKPSNMPLPPSSLFNRITGMDCT